MNIHQKIQLARLTVIAALVGATLARAARACTST